MTLRWLALALAVVLAVPAVAVILRTARAGVDESRGPAARRVEALWVALPLVLLAALIALSAQAG
ncbi:MAG: hypothetical protein QOD86_2435 [Miltoncostaeaceae bacterium]|jgi:heme/copper-type cytochrome/quinol oxidase subunit 2|nr:hypothetical protein [Miltoncostaeaceae bacterium]